MDSLPEDHFVKAQQFTKSTYRDVYPAIDPKNESFSQAGKVIIITGASRGLGAQGFVPSFATTGAKALVLVAKDAKKLQDTAEFVRKQYPHVETLPVPTDIADPTAVAALFDQVKEKYGHADVLVNNAGVAKVLAPVKDTDPQEWWNDMTINIRGTYLMTRSFLKLLPSSETQARIITVTTGASYAVFPGVSAYGLSKLVVLQLMEYIAAENPNVLAVAIHPGVIPTDMTFDIFMPFAQDTPQLVGGLATWLAAWEGPTRDFLRGKYVSANWDVNELLNREKEIVDQGLLKLDLKGDYGYAHFG